MWVKRDAPAHESPESAGGAAKYRMSLREAGLATAVQRQAGQRQQAQRSRFGRDCQLAELEADRLGWNPAEFCGFRVVMKYPAMPAALIFQHGLAQPPAN